MKGRVGGWQEEEGGGGGGEGGEDERGRAKVINLMITCLYNPNGNQTRGFFTAVPRAFIIMINSLDSPNSMLTNNALYP